MSVFTLLTSIFSLCPQSINLSSHEKSTLVAASRDRAVLLLEIHDFVLLHHLHLPQRSVDHVHDLQSFIADKCPDEMMSNQKFAYKLAPGRYFKDKVANSRPPAMSWLTWLATGSPITSGQVADALYFVFDEENYVRKLRDHGHKVATYSQRCASSGMSELRPAVNLDKGSDLFKVPRERMKPRDRIASLRYVAPSEDVLVKRKDVPWEYRGVLEQEARLRIQLATIPGSWTYVQSGLRSYDSYMSIQHPFAPHFPVRFGPFGAFCCTFDNASTLSQYVTAIKKAHNMAELPFLSDEQVASVKRGAAKFAPVTRKSFIDHAEVEKLTNMACANGRPDLARCMSVSYLYQGRVQNEILPLESDRRDRVPASSEKWHSYVVLGPQSAEIVLRSRKNKPVVSRVMRECQCHLTPKICGVCALKKQLRVAKQAGQKKIFWSVRASDIRLVQTWAIELGLGRPTWHGFRRGRTSDLVTCVHWNLNVSLLDIFESGGWTVGSRAILKYLSEFAKDKERLVQAFSAGSDSD